MRVSGYWLLVAGSLSAQRPDTVVRMATAPVHAGVAELKRELAIGVADGDEKYMFGGLDDFAIAANGSIFVLDKSVPIVRMYDANGKFVRTVGQRGSGPGEYQRSGAITIAKNGNLLFWDQGNARINVYSPSGDALTSWPTHGGNMSSSGRNLMRSDTAGSTYIRTLILDRSRGTISRSFGWTRFDSSGKLRDTLMVPASPSEAVLSAERGGSSMTFNVPFAPVFYSELSPHGYLVTGLSSRVALDLHEPNKPLASVRRDVTLKPVTSRERDSARADVTEKFHKSYPDWSWNGPDIPRSKAAYVGFNVASDGRIWVALERGPRHEDPDATGPGGGGGVSMSAGRGPGRGTGAGWSCPMNGWALHDVYEPSGRYLGQVKIADKVEPIVMRGDFVWAATCNEDDVPQVVRYRIAWK